MDSIQLELLNYINNPGNKDYLKELLISDPEYFMIFINMEILGNELGLDISHADNEVVLKSVIEFITKNI
jgi:hypothetical protein